MGWKLPIPGEDGSRLGRCLSFQRIVAGVLLLVLTFRYPSPFSLVLTGTAVSYLLFAVGTVLRGSHGLNRTGSDRLVTGIDLLTAVLVFLFYSVSPTAPALLLFPFVLFEIGILYQRTGMQIAVPLFGSVALLRALQVGLLTHQFLPRWEYLVTFSGVSLGLLFLAATLCATDEEREKALLRQKRLSSGYQAALEEVLAAQGLFLQNLQEPELRNSLSDLPPGVEAEEGVRLGQQLVALMRLHRDDLPRLTRREQEVLALMAQGMSYGRIARILVVSEGTIRAHAAGILRKMQARNRQEAVTLARELRLV